MPVINTWSKVGVAVQTTLAAADTITAATKANPCVMTSTGHGLSTGNEVYLEINGMTELNQAVVRITVIDANSFSLDGIDSTNFGTFTSGTAKLVTFGATAATLTELSASGGEAQPIDVTTIHDDTAKEIPGIKSALSYNFGSLWDPSDAALLALKAADDVKGIRAIRFTFASGAKVYLAAYPSCSLAPTGSSNAPVTTPVSLRVNGRVTAYTS